MIHRNVLTNEELSAVRKVLKKPHWVFKFISTDPEKPIWNFDKEIGKEVAELIFSKLSGFELLDWHINGQTFGLDAAPHKDSNLGATHSFVFFPMPWNYLFGGRLHILYSSPVVITPEENAGVFMDASVLHYADGPSIEAKSSLRISVSLKLRKK